MSHHTAGADNAEGEANYMCFSADARPIANLAVDSKIAVICAGGATNTNGSGKSIAFSRGTVAKDDMNKRAVGIEICNNGVGAPYPERQINFLIRLSNLINERCGNQPTDVMTHQFYAPDRKVDPSRADSVQGPWKPRSCTSSGSWNVDDLKAECKKRASGSAPAPEPTTPKIPLGAIHDEGDEMFVGVKDGQYWIGNGLGRRNVEPDDLDHIISMYAGSGNPLKSFQSGKPVTARSQVPSGKQMSIMGVNVAP